MASRSRLAALAFVTFAPLPLLFLLSPPIAQDPRYHAFADQRAWLGIANFLNVASNLAFVVVAALGVALCVSARRPGASRAWLCFFVATGLVAAGSAYYHLAPSDGTLVWDRLPMALAFMALFSAVLSEHVDERLELPLLLGALTVAVASVAWWRYTGDLRPYVWVQFGPFLALLFLLAAFPPTFSHRRWLAYGALFYAGAKLCELGDAEVLRVTGVASGHTLKHLTAAIAPFCVYVMLRSRSRVSSGPEVMHA
jgi:hypothetical protein